MVGRRQRWIQVVVLAAAIGKTEEEDAAEEGASALMGLLGEERRGTASVEGDCGFNTPIYEGRRWVCWVGCERSGKGKWRLERAGKNGIEGEMARGAPPILVSFGQGAVSGCWVREKKMGLQCCCCWGCLGMAGGWKINVMVGKGLNGWFRREKNPAGWGAALWVDRFRVRFSPFIFCIFLSKLSPPLS